MITLNYIDTNKKLTSVVFLMHRPVRGFTNIGQIKNLALLIFSVFDAELILNMNFVKDIYA